MFNKYIYSYCDEETFPWLCSIEAVSYSSAFEKLQDWLIEKLHDDKIYSFDVIKDLQCYLNDKYGVIISDLQDIETL